VRSFLTTTPRYATIATADPDGRPHQVVIWFLLRRDDLGDFFVVNSRLGRRWPANLRRDPRASLAVYAAEDAVTLDCELIDSYTGAAAQADIAEMAHRYDTPAAAEREIERFRTEERISFRLRPIKTNLHGDPD
jgi:predicted pyridoxine 5'-phosphate oxidase superfamily flavin-nucleotide-binding protein